MSVSLATDKVGVTQEQKQNAIISVVPNDSKLQLVFVLAQLV